MNQLGFFCFVFCLFGFFVGWFFPLWKKVLVGLWKNLCNLWKKGWAQWARSSAVERALQICLTTFFFLKSLVWIMVTLLITVLLKTKTIKPLPPVPFGKDPCAGKLDLKESLILHRPIAHGDGHFLPCTNYELYLKIKTFNGNWPFWVFRS